MLGSVLPLRTESVLGPGLSRMHGFYIRSNYCIILTWDRGG